MTNRYTSSKGGSEVDVIRALELELVLELLKGTEEGVSSLVIGMPFSSPRLAKEIYLRAANARCPNASRSRQDERASNIAMEISPYPVRINQNLGANNGEREREGDEGAAMVFYRKRRRLGFESFPGVLNCGSDFGHVHHHRYED